MILHAFPFFAVILQLVVVVGASNEQTRKMYKIRPLKVNRERGGMEIIDLASFLLTNSEDGRPKTMVPFYLNLFETRGDLSDDAIQNVEDATSQFLLSELNTAFKSGRVAKVDTRITKQERFVKQIDNRNLIEKSDSYGVLRRRQLRQVPGSKLEVDVNVTFDREPSPGVSDVDDSLQFIMKDLVFLVDNITATEDPELGYVFMAFREEISPASENPTTLHIQKPIEEKKDRKSMKFIIPTLVALVILGAIVALLVVQRRRRRAQAANQKAQEDLEEIDTDDYDVHDSCSRYSSSQGSLSHTAPNYGVIMDVGSPTGRSSLSGASTVKVSNAILMPLPSKLTELAATSMFAFSEKEEEGFETSTEGGNSLMITPSLQQSEASNGSSAFNRIMNGKSDDEGISSINSFRGPRQEIAPPTESRSMMESSTGQQVSSKSSFGSLFSSTFFSTGGDSVSHFNGSTLTVQAANTSEAVRKKAMRSFSLSPQHNKLDNPAFRVPSPQAKSHNGGDDQSADSLFDFLVTSLKTKSQEDTITDHEVPEEEELSETLPECPENTYDQNWKARSTPVECAVGTTTATRTASTNATLASTASASLSQNAEVSSVPTSQVAPSVPTPGTAKAHNTLSATSCLATLRTTSTKVAAAESPFPSNESSNAALGTLRNFKKVAMTPQTPIQAQTLKPRAQVQADCDDVSTEEDLFSDDDAPGSFPRRNRRHVKSTTHDGTFAYQTDAMQPQEWSITDGCSDDDTLSEQGGEAAAFGAFPKAGFRSPKSAQKRLDRSHEKSPSNQSKSTCSQSQVTQNSPGSKADSSQASANRQLINDLVWLSKKITGVKQSAVDSAPKLPRQAQEQP